MGGTCAEFSSVRKFGSAKNSRSFDPASLGSAGFCGLDACPDEGVAAGAALCGCCAGVCCPDCAGAGGGASACGRAELPGAMQSSAIANKAEKTIKGCRLLIVM